MKKTNIALLIRFYRCLCHKDVTHIIEETLDLSQFTIIRNQKSTIYIPKKLSSDKVPLLTAHTDTVFEGAPSQFEVGKNSITALKSKHGIGGDDRNGCYIIYHIMRLRPNDFIFVLFDEEECGCHGSHAIDLKKILPCITLFLGLDRKGDSDMVTYGYHTDELKTEMKKIPNYKSAWGSCTDVMTLANRYKLCCINFSVGYYSNHSANEKTIFSHLNKTIYTILNKLPESFWQKAFECKEKEVPKSYRRFSYDNTYGNYSTPGYNKRELKLVAQSLYENKETEMFDNLYTKHDTQYPVLIMYKMDIALGLTTKSFKDYCRFFENHGIMDKIEYETIINKLIRK